jgi:hypothetical protein
VNRVVNLAGLVQGITLVTFPAASSIFTDTHGVRATNSQQIRRARQRKRRTVAALERCAPGIESGG